MIPCLLAALTAAAPPIKGRPDDFIGAVGKFTLSAAITPSRFRLDETSTLSLKLDGKGDVSQVRTPDLSHSRTFADRLDVVGPASRTVEESGVQFTYPIRARSVDVDAVPSIRLSIYDDSPPRPQYRLLRTAELPIEVLPVQPQEPSLRETPPPAPGPTFGSWTPIIAVAAVALVVMWFLRPASRKPLEITTTPRPKGRRGKPIDKPAEFVRNGSDRWLDELANALGLPPGKRTSAEILAAARGIRLEEKWIPSLEQSLAALDASRFGRRDSRANDEDLRAITSEIARLVDGSSVR